MAYVITDSYISNKGASGTQRSPVECIHPTPEHEGIMLNGVTAEVVAR
ncbi:MULTISPECIES: hypothetical protein [unclassified Mycobacterium]|nr:MULTISPECIES: hypothetical protein [unclassified Mycobacterium]SEA62158.1 hypothetical protein SAMN04488580_103471 [Mycobacterium sp. 283mftsu]